MLQFLQSMLSVQTPPRRQVSGVTNAGGQSLPTFAEYDPAEVPLTKVAHPDGRFSYYPPVDKWDDWIEYDGKSWPRKVARRYMLIPTVCFNCESACGL
ncbi:MAG: hypothetical protein KC425_20290, partial [Anaerolineales bacterium]|nr:hypothetical protein [Anaerolineales bacterium]